MRFRGQVRFRVRVPMPVQVPLPVQLRVRLTDRTELLAVAAHGTQGPSGSGAMKKEMSLSGDRREGTHSHDWRIEAASVTDFNRALERLDARVFTMLTIEGPAEQHLMIGGGGGRYVVYAAVGNDEYWNLLRPEPASGTILLNTGGQVGDFRASQVVG